MSKLKFMPITGVHTQSEAAVWQQRILCLLYSLALHMYSMNVEYSADGKTSCFLIIISSFSVDLFSDFFQLQHDLNYKNIFFILS